MAQFCKKCGTPITPGLQFCTGCGAAVGAPAVQTMPMQPGAMAPPAAPVAAQPSSGSPVVKIVLIVVAILLILGMLCAASCAYFLYRAKQRVNQFQRQGITFPVTQPGGSMGRSSGPVIDLSVPVYPGATTGEPGANVTMGGAALKSQEYTTGDSVDQVVAFYKSRLPNAIITQNGQNALAQISGSNGYANIAIAQDSNSGKTKVTISSIGK